MDADHFEYSTISSSWPSFVRAKGRTISVGDLQPGHPPDCEREVCPVMIEAKNDFVGRAAAR